jgi:hypothetical protein
MWQDHALCKGLTALFYAPHPRTRDLGELCSRCPVFDDCYDDAVMQPFGYQAGMTEQERRNLRRRLGTFAPLDRVIVNIRHGTESGCNSHYRLGEPACYACLAAKAHANRLRAAAKRLAA